MTNKENYDRVDAMLDNLLDVWRESEHANWLTSVEWQEFVEDYEIARNCLQNLLIASDKSNG